jgi:CMP-N,N'-diacetyllegionaminic acid synthase
MSGTLGEVLAIVPARGRSRRLPRKHLRKLAGRPLIDWTLEAARRASRIDRIVVSTDDQRIIACARRMGVDVPVVRPGELARDDTPGIEPILHMVEWLAEHERYRPHIVVVLQATSPLRTAEDIDAALDLMVSRRTEAVVSVSPAPCQASWLRHVDAGGRLGSSACETDDEAMHVVNGALYATTRANLLATRSVYADPTYAYVMPRERGVDIDTAYDWAVAECFMRLKERP